MTLTQGIISLFSGTASDMKIIHRSGALVIFLLLSVTVSAHSEQNESAEIKSAAVEISSADLRLSPVIPGPRYLNGNDLNNNNRNSGFMASIADNPGYAFLASAAIPGLGQAANSQWWKTAIFVAAEATAIGIYIHRENRGRDGERYYEEYGNEHWSVVQYAQYVVTNHKHEHGKEFKDLLKSDFLDDFNYDENRPFGGIEPVFDIDVEWDMIDRQALNEAERNSLYATGNYFSHSVEPYGSQQYYELMSKYFQFGPGWRQWDSGIHDIDKQQMPENFWYHAQIGFDFNDDLSVARNMLTLLITNHFVSAFDAYFTQKLRENRMQPTASMEYGLRPTFGFNYRF